MTKQTHGGNRNGRRGDPNQDVQPWLGWVAALLVVVIVVVAVAMGMERTGSQRTAEAEVRMTPLVGGMALPATAGTASGEPEVAEITPLAAVVTETTAITGGETLTGTEQLTETAEMSVTDAVTPTDEMSATAAISETDPLSATGEVTVTDEVTVTVDVTPEITLEATSEVGATEETSATLEAAPAPTKPPTPRPTSTPQPLPTAIVNPPTFAEGEIVAGSGQRVAIHADASLDATVLDSYGSGVPLEVLPPSGDYTTYPVEVDGHGWVRVRAADGLVGWVMTDQVEAQ